MAIIALPAVQDISTAGIDLTDNTAGLTTTDTFTFPNDGKTFLHFKKSGAGACTVTIVTPGVDADGNAIADKTVNVPATTGDVMVGPFRRDIYNDPATGLVTISLSNVTGLSIALARLSNV